MLTSLAPYDLAHTGRGPAPSVIAARSENSWPLPWRRPCRRSDRAGAPSDTRRPRAANFVTRCELLHTRSIGRRTKMLKVYQKRWAPGGADGRRPNPPALSDSAMLNKEGGRCSLGWSPIRKEFSSITNRARGTPAAFSTCSRSAPDAFWWQARPAACG